MKKKIRNYFHNKSENNFIEHVKIFLSLFLISKEIFIENTTELFRCIIIIKMIKMY